MTRGGIVKLTEVIDPAEINGTSSWALATNVIDFLSRLFATVSGYTFPLSYRDIEKMMLYRGIEVTYETVRNWCQRFAQDYANQIRKRRRIPVDKWHLDEVMVTIKGEHFYLW